MATAGTRRERQHEPGADDREDGAEQHAVDREPPVGETRCDRRG